ncbi:hypothetical protein BS17DRAFT_786834 [Gyrodon lividus]|nr:hypothetical protein BS17DRAFT_786834 [Gyrodon lividus]
MTSTSASQGQQGQQQQQPQQQRQRDPGRENASEEVENKSGEDESEDSLSERRRLSCARCCRWMCYDIVRCYI